MHKTISQLLAAAGEGPDRVAPSELSHEMAAGALAVDIGPARQRDHYGKISGAMIIDPNVLEWRLDPSSPNRIPEMIDYDRRIVIVCQEGYASSLAHRNAPRTRPSPSDRPRWRLPSAPWRRGALTSHRPA